MIAFVAVSGRSVSLVSCFHGQRRPRANNGERRQPCHRGSALALALVVPLVMEFATGF
jgi:hypothetical protein